MVLFPTSIYLMFGGKDIQQILVLSIVFAALGTILSFFIPESPRYLYERKFYKDLRKNLSFIAKINGTTMEENYLFETESREI
mmetsp:Transcript_20357/g.18026  ORF Transcript_20357/g.18026 Transcript_20357/m.18026 type:complete len:83 (+) Transcript_20357:663-911(+)